MYSQSALAHEEDDWDSVRPSEQAKLLDAFEQMKAWQKQQQDIMMRQQKEQMEKLLAEHLIDYQKETDDHHTSSPGRLCSNY